MLQLANMLDIFSPFFEIFAHISFGQVNIEINVFLCGTITNFSEVQLFEVFFSDRPTLICYHFWLNYVGKEKSRQYGQPETLQKYS